MPRLPQTIGLYNGEELQGTGSKNAARIARAKLRAKEMMAEMSLAEIRQAAGLTQEQVAADFGVKQPTLSRIESQDEMHLSTLQRLVRALGGELEIIAHLPGRDVRIRQFKESA